MTRLAIKGATLIGAARRPTTGDIYIEGSRIAGIGRAPRGFAGVKQFKARGLHVMPALLDRMTGSPPDADDLASAAAGGTGYVLSRGSHASLPTRSAQHVELAELLAEDGSIGDLVAAAEAGARGFWWQDKRGNSASQLLRGMQLAASCDLPVVADPRLVELDADSPMATGFKALRLGLAGMPAAAETAAVSLLIECASEAGCRLHLAGLSCARSVELIAAARSRKIAVTADVHAANLLLDDEDVDDFSLRWRVYPPLRSKDDRKALAAGLADGTIDSLVTAHASLPAARDGDLFAQAAPGVSAAGLQLSLALEWASRAGLKPAAAAQETWQVCGGRLSAALGLDLKLEADAPANLIVFDNQGEHTVSEHEAGIGANSPFAGMRLRGELILAMINGGAVPKG